MTDRIERHVQREGSGERTVVLLHGIMMSGEVFEKQVELLAKDHRILIPDLRGFGRSELGTMALTPDAFTDDLLAFLDEEGVDMVDLVGWSMGGAIAIRFAARFPDRVSNLVLLDTTPCLIAQPDFPHAVPPEAAEALGGLLASDYPAGSQAFVEMIFPEPDADEQRARAFEITQQTTKEVVLGCFGTFGGADLRGDLAEIQARTTVIVGSEDAVCPPGASEYLAESIAGATLNVVPGAGHAGFWTRPDQCNPLILQALSATGAEGTE